MSDAPLSDTTISACTVTVHSDVRYLRYWLSSLRECSTLVRQVIVADVNPESKIRDTARLLDDVWCDHVVVIPITCMDARGHPIGLHECLKHVTSDYVLLSDPDIFYYMKDFDAFLLRNHLQHDLLISGITHWRWKEQAYRTFPSVLQMLIKRVDLPPADFLKGKLHLGMSKHVFLARKMKPEPKDDGFWLSRGAIISNIEHYPFPDGVYDVGANLYEYCFQRKGRWIAYAGGPDQRPRWVKVYRTRNFNNFGLADDFGCKPLLYHQARSMRPSKRRLMFDQFIEAYKRRNSLQ